MGLPADWKVPGSMMKHELVPLEEIPKDEESDVELLAGYSQNCTMGDIVLPERISTELVSIIVENKKAKRLAKYGLEPRRKILLMGLPGTGKTMTAMCIAGETGLPLIQVSLDAVVASLLGETGKNLRKVFDYVTKNKCVVLFDEFDFLGMARNNDSYDTAEMKRVVTNFMQLLDKYDGESLLVATTNHSHMLDPALWRRFDSVIRYELPDIKARRLISTKCLGAVGGSAMLTENELEMMEGYSGADVTAVCIDALRSGVVAGRKCASRNDITAAISRHMERMRERDGMAAEARDTKRAGPGAGFRGH